MSYDLHLIGGEETRTWVCVTCLVLDAQSVHKVAERKSVRGS